MAVKKPISQDFSDISGGLNTAKPAVAIGGNQIQACLNTIIKEQGWGRSPGYLGMKTTAEFSAYIRGLHVYEQVAGTETLIALSGGKLYTVATSGASSGDITDLYNLTGTGEGWFCNAFDKCFVANGTILMKAESPTVAYRVGIVAPTGATIAAVAGGTLPDGSYDVYVSYARKVSGANALYSIGQALGTVVLGTGSNTIRVTCADSADAQVNNKVVWVREAGGSIWYYYGESGDNTTEIINISSDAAKNSDLLYSVAAAPNALPGALQGVYFFDNRLFGFINDKYYWSDKGLTSFKLEIWRSANVGTLPFNILSMFSMNGSLYFNTTGGIICLPSGDVNSRYVIKDTRWYFRFPRTVDYWGGSVIGVTNNGVRIFDGEKFTTFDYGKDIKPEIEKLYSSYSSNFPPCGKVTYRTTRTEYHLSFRDTAVSSLLCNRHLVLNLSSVAVYDEIKYKVPWEEWEGGFSYLVNSKDNALYYGQSLANGGQIFKETNSSSADRYVYDKAGTFLTALTEKNINITSRDFLINLSASVTWQTVQLIAQLSSTASLRIAFRDSGIPTSTKAMQVNDGAEFDSAIFDASYFAIETPTPRNIPLKRQLSGKISYLVFSQTADDINLSVIAIALLGTLRKTRFT